MICRGGGAYRARTGDLLRASQALSLAETLVQWASTANLTELEAGLKALGVRRPRVAG